MWCDLGHRAKRMPKLSVLAIVTLFAFTALYLPLYIRDLNSAEIYASILGNDFFSANVLPAYLLILCFCSVRFSEFELVRRPARHELRDNLWLIVLASCVVSLLLTVELAALSGAVPNDESLSMARALSLIFAQSTMTLMEFGLIELALYYAGIRWGVSIPVMLGTLIMTEWVLSNNIFGSIQPFWFFYLVPDANSFFSRLLSFIGFVIVMLAVNDLLFMRRDHMLKEK